VVVRLVLFGRQGAGKGTQSSLLAEHFDAPHISTGDMLREVAADGSEVGRRVKDYIDQGLLIPDDTMLDVTWSDSIFELPPDVADPTPPEGSTGSAGTV